MHLPAGHKVERRTVENTTGRPLTLILEPWADELSLAPGNHLVVEIEGPARYADVFVDASGLDRGNALSSAFFLCALGSAAMILLA